MTLQPPLSDEEEKELPQAKLVRAKDIGQPEIKAWKFTDLEADEANKQQKLRSDVLNSLRQEVAPEVKRQANLLKKEAYEKAHAEGYEAGFQQGLEAGKKEAFEKAELEAKALHEPQIERLNSILSFLQTPIKETEEAVFQHFSQLAIQVAETFIKQQVESEPDWVLQAIKDAISLLPEETVVLKIELNPQDIQLVESYQQEFSQNWQLHPNPDMPLGSCRIKQNFSTIDNIWQDQLASYLNKVKDSVKSVEQNSSSISNATEAV